MLYYSTEGILGQIGCGHTVNTVGHVYHAHNSKQQCGHTDCHNAQDHHSVDKEINHKNSRLRC